MSHIHSRVRLAALVLLSAAPAMLVAQAPTESASSLSPATTSAASLTSGRHYTALFLAGKIDSLWARFAPPMKAAMKNDVATLRAFHAQVVGQLGAEKELVSEDMRPAGQYDLYIRTVRMQKVPGERFVVRWAVAKDGSIGGFEIRAAPDAAPSPHMAYQTKTALQLPFDGDWYVVWGGRTVDQNHHAVDAEQRFALDMLVKREGASFKGEGKELGDYYCFDQPILAPGAGTIVKTVDGMPDNPIGTTDARNPAGNHVVIDHGNGEFSILGHLKYASLVVEMGDTVKAGDRIASCGNSGNTSEPHLHYQLQDQAAMFAGAKGLPAQFAGYTADGKPVTRGEPLRGQTIRRATAAPGAPAPSKP